MCQGGDGYVHYLNCDDGFMYVKTYVKLNKSKHNLLYTLNRYNLLHIIFS